VVVSVTVSDPFPELNANATPNPTANATSALARISQECLIGRL
jgi:hypothetical protein